MNEQQDTSKEIGHDTARFETTTDAEVNAAELTGNPHVDALSRDIGPRAPGSSNESTAADYLVSALRNVGLPAARLTARTTRFESLTEMLFALTGLVALVVAILLPAAGLLLLLAALSVMLADLLGYVQLSSRIPVKDSVNVLSIVPPGETEIRRLIVTATLDTGQVGLLARLHWAFGYAWMHAGILLGIVLGIVITVIDIARAAGVPNWLYALPAFILLVCLTLLIERALSTQYSPGAITNASGVAALVEIAANAAAQPPQWLEIWFLGVGGGSSTSGGGMRDFLEKNTFDPDITYFVHLQSPGGGSPVVPRAAGAGLRSAPATPLLTWIFDSVREADNASSPARLNRLPVATQAHTTHRAGYQSAVVAGVNEQRKIPFLDDAGDVRFQVNVESIKETVRLVQAGINALDREVAARAMLARSTASIQNVEESPPEEEGLPSDEE